MSSVLATVTQPTRKITFPSNCLINYDSNILSMKDDTATKPFEQKAQFDSIAPSFESFLSRVPATGKFRIVSFCSEFTMFTTQSIKDTCLKFAKVRFPQKSKNPQFIALGFVYDSSVRDFLSLDEMESDKFELIETFDVAEMLDLLECGLEKLRRIKDSVFVIHIGTENNFFEWIIVPKADSYVPSPSMAGLPPNEKFFFILNQLQTINSQSFERFRRLSSIFRLVGDSFADVPTWWVFHIAEEVTLKSNATLCKVAAMITGSKDIKFNRYQSDFYFIQNDEDVSLSSGASDDYLQTLTPEELAELEYLKSKVGESSSLKLSSGNLEMENRRSNPKFNLTIDGREKSSLSFNEADFVDEEEDEYEYEEEDQSERVGDGDQVLKKPKRRKKKAKKVVVEKPTEKTAEELQAEEDERRRKEEEEEEERRKTVELLRKARSPKVETPKSVEKHKSKSVRSAKSIMESSQFSKMSKRDKVSERIAKLKQMRENEEEEDEEEDSSELKELKNKKELTPEERYKKEMQKRLKNRQKKFTKISVLVNKAKKASNDKNASLSNLENLQAQVDEALVEAKQFRADAKDEIEYLRDTLAYRKQKHAQNEIDVKEIRNVYLERHCENVQEIDKRKRKEARMKAEFLKQENEEKTGKRSKQDRTIAITNRTPEYDMAVKYLEEEIEKVKIDIAILKKRPANPSAA